jgi:hypothetical protein
MNPQDPQTQTTGTLPTAADIAPAELKSPVPVQSVSANTADFENWLDQHSGELSNANASTPANGGENIGMSSLSVSLPRFVAWIFILMVTIPAVAFGAYGAYTAIKHPAKTPANQTAAVTAPEVNFDTDTGSKTLHINFDTIIDKTKKLTATGDVLIQNDSANGFAVQNGLGNDVLAADTAGGKVSIGGAVVNTNSAALQVTGDISTNGALVSTKGSYALNDQGLTLGGQLICTSAGCKSIDQIAGLDTTTLAKLKSNQTFSGANTFSSGSNVFNGNGAGLASLNASNISGGTLGDGRLSGNVALKGSNNFFTGSNTFNNQLQAAGGINSIGYSINGTPGTTLSCGPSELLQQGIIQNGILTSGSCVAIAGGTIPTLQQVYDASVPATIALSSTSGGFQVQDAASPLGTNLFSVTDNGATTTYFAVSSLGISVTGDVSTTGQFVGSGAGLTSLNASNVASGTLNDGRLSANVTLKGNVFNGANQLVQLTAGGILPVLNGSNLTALNASNIGSGTLADARLSANVALLNANNTFTGNDSFHLNSTALTVQDAGSPLAGNLFEVTNNSGATKYFSVSATAVKVNGNDVCTTAGNCVGTGSGGAIGGSGTAATIPVFTGSGFTIGDSLLSQAGGTVTANGNLNLTTGNQFRVNGAQISSANLSNDSNLAKLNGTQTFTGGNTFSNAANSFTGNGAGLTSLNASNVSSGTLSDARLSTNVALLNANQTFTGNNAFTLSTTGLAVQDAASPLGTTLFKVTNNAGTTTYFSVSATQLKFNGNDVCTTTGNCAGVGGGVTTAGGTTNKLAKFTAGQAIGDSIITDNGSTVTIGGTLSVNTLTPTAALTVGSTSQGLTLQGNGTTTISATSSGITNSIVFTTPASSNKTITVPNATGTIAVSASGPLSLDAAGNLTCPSCLTNNGSGGGSGVSSINSLTGGVTLAGTANQITITPSGSTLTFSTPQDIATSSSPQFANVNVTGQFKVNGSQIASSNLSDSANLAKLNANQTFTGNNTFQNAANGTSTFQIQDLAGTSNLFIADTSHTRIAIAQATATYTLDVGGDVNTTTGYRVSGTAGSSVTCSSGNVLQNPVITGGIITGGTCIANGGGGSTPTFTQVYNAGATSADETASLTSARGGIVIKDNATPIGADLFTVQSNGGTKFLDVTSAGISVSGDVDITGNYKISGSQISSANLSNDANLAKLSANQKFYCGVPDPKRRGHHHFIKC